MKQELCFGVDIGGTKTAVVVGRECDSNIEIIKRIAFSSTPADPDTTVKKILQLLSALSASYGTPAAVGVACGGPLDAVKGVIHAPPNLPAWENVAIVDYIQDRLGVPAALENDADAGALAEHRYGAGRGTNNMIFLTFGTGLGAGLILNGQLYRGASGSAGEVGHVRLAPDGPVGYHKAGSFEGFCSGGGLRQLGHMCIARHLEQGDTTDWALRNRENTELNAREIADAARNGDAIAMEIMHLCGTRFGEGLAILIDILNPQRIIAGSIFYRCRDLLLEPMERAIQREALPGSARACTILPAQLGEQIGDFAALSIAFDQTDRMAENLAVNL